MIERDHLGRGLAFPLCVDLQGRLALADGALDVEQAIRIILQTAPGERLMRPEFGCRLHELVFAPQNAATRKLAAHYVEEAIERWEPRVSLDEVKAVPDPQRSNVLLVQMTYRVLDTHNERTIVYPFYLNPELGAQG